MTPTPTKPRKPTPKPARSVTLTTLTNGKLCLWITDAKQTRAYILKPIASGWGVAWQLGKADNGDGSMENYSVLIDTTHGKHCCDCAAHTFSRDGRSCKHVEALLALIQSGKLPLPVTAAPDAKSETPTARTCQTCGKIAKACYCYRDLGFDDP